MAHIVSRHHFVVTVSGRQKSLATSNFDHRHILINQNRYTGNLRITILAVSNTILNKLELKLDQLISLCERLDRENKNLREKESDWARERTRLIEKNELARARVEAMIVRLKSLESQA